MTRWLILFAIFTLTSLCPAMVRAQPRAPLEYREHLVPEEDLRDLVDGLMPMSRKDFLELSGGGTPRREAESDAGMTRTCWLVAPIFHAARPRAGPWADARRGERR